MILMQGMLLWLGCFSSDMRPHDGVDDSLLSSDEEKHRPEPVCKEMLAAATSHFNSIIPARDDILPIPKLNQFPFHEYQTLKSTVGLSRHEYNSILGITKQAYELQPLDSCHCCRFDWQEADLERLKSVELLAAADVAYDDDLTDAFLHCALKLMIHILANSGKRLAFIAPNN